MRCVIGGFKREKPILTHKKIRRFAFLEQKKSKMDTLEGATREKFYEVESIYK